MRGLRESAWIWVDTHHEVLLSIPKSPTETPPRYRGAQGAALPPLPHPKEKLLSDFPNSLKQALPPVQSCSRSESLGELPWPSRALGSSTKGTSAPTAKCQMVHLRSRNHGQSSEREQAARARLVVSCALRQLDLNTISEL